MEESWKPPTLCEPLGRAHTDGCLMRHCKIHRVQHLNVSRAADAPAAWVNNDLRINEAGFSHLSYDLT